MSAKSEGTRKPRLVCIRVWRDQRAKDWDGDYAYLPSEGVQAKGLIPWHAFDERWTGTAKEAREIIASIQADGKHNPELVYETRPAPN